MKQKKNKKREKYEQNNCGGFELIYPTTRIELMTKYNMLSEGALQLINEH